MNNLLFIGGLGGQEIVLIFFVVLLLFGGKKIPELMRGVGKGIREFNSARSTIEDEIKQGMKEEDKKLNAEKKRADDLERQLKEERRMREDNA